MFNNTQVVENHLFEMEGQYFFFDVRKCDLYNLDIVAYIIAELCNDRTSEEIISLASNQLSLPYSSVKEVFDELVELGLIYDKDNNDNGYSDPSFNFEKENVVSTLALHIVHDCNLRCTYCYGDGGSYGGERKKMPEEVALKSIDFLVNQNYGEHKVFNISFFGGEPFMNFDLIKEVTEYCRSIENRTDLRFNLGLTTNGTCFTEEILEYVEKNRISIGISIDGPKYIHDEYRKYASKKGSYDDVMEGANKLLKQRDGRVTARITVTKQNLNIFDITQQIEKLGFKKINFALVSVDKDSPLAIGEENYPEIAKEYKKIANKMIESVKRKERFHTNLFYSHLRLLNKKEFMFYACGAGRRYLAVSPEGNFYLCQRFVGIDKYKVGNIYEGLTTDLNEFASSIKVTARKGCSKCWARFLCGGACLYQAINNEDSLLSAPEQDCKTYKDLYEATMYLYWKLTEEDDTLIDRLLAPAGSNYYDENNEDKIVI